MKLIILNFIFVVGCSIAVGQNGYPSEKFLEPDIENLIPFSSDQLERIRQNNIRRVEEHRYLQNDTLTTVYFFNQAGQLLREADGYTEVNYKYNPRGKLKIRVLRSGCLLNYDSIIYNSRGWLVFYASYGSYLNCGLPEDSSEHFVNFQLRLFNRKGKHVLVDKKDPHYPIYYELTSGNQTILRIQPDQRDSISKEFSDRDDWKEIFWQKSTHLPYGYMCEWIPRYRVFQTRSYKDSLLIEYNILSQTDSNDTISSVNYYYNNQGQPLHLEFINDNMIDNMEIFFQYDSRLLLSHKIEKHRDYSIKSEYHYFFD